jgi:hypothetical protein
MHRQAAGHPEEVNVFIHLFPPFVQKYLLAMLASSP